jgi:hypothetical protein
VDGECGMHGRGEKNVQGFGGKAECPLGTLRHRWEDGIMMDLREIGWGGVEQTHLAQDRDQWRALVYVVVNLWVLVPWS